MKNGTGFKVGDRVEFAKTNNYYIKEGCAGNIIDMTGSALLIEFDEFVDGYDGYGYDKLGHCSWVLRTEIRKINIETDQYEEWDDV